MRQVPGDLLSCVLGAAWLAMKAKVGPDGKLQSVPETWCDEDAIQDDLSEAWPILDAPDLNEGGWRFENLSSYLIYLNDREGFTREEIASQLERKGL